MQNLKILNSKEVKRILKLLNEQFGYEEKLECVFLINKKFKVYIINRDISRVDLEALRIDSLGMYLGTYKNGFRPSIEGSQIVGPKAKKNILEITEEEMNKWLKGEDFNVDTELKGFVLVKHKNDFLGCGNIKEGELFNYVPKSRRLIIVNN
jgi:NOL1/NOP2/fmu family ribosome biogenesis protein